MKKILFFIALLVGVLNFLWSTPSVMAFSDIIVPGPMPSPSIQPWTDDTSLTSIDYYVSSTGATSGIRYKTLYYYITLRDTNGNPIATYSFQPSVASPPPGETVIDLFTVTAQDLLNAGFSPSSLQIGNFSHITLSATILIYNADTGEEYYRIGDANSTPATIYPTIEQDAGSLGFGSQDILDMESRYASLADLVQSNPPPGEPATDEQVSGSWSWYEYSGNYYEKTWMTITPPDPAVVKAGQGTAVTVTTYYENNNPASWNGSRYTTGIDSMTINGPLTDDWQAYKSFNTRTTDDMILTNTEVYYQDYYPQTYSHTEYWSWTDADGNVHTSSSTYYFYVGYNVPVEVKTWIIPYARFDDVTGWTRHQTPPTDIDNRYVFGGLNRWYFGFDIPDGQTFDLRFMAQGGVSNNLTVCKGTTITILGGAYDDVIVRTVDPENPFPGGVPANWRGKEHYITDLIDWFKASEIAYQRKVAAWRQGATLRGAYEYLSRHLMEGIHRLLGSPQNVGW